MTLPDIILLILLLTFAVSGVRRGLIWELLTTLGLVLGFGLVYYFRADITDLSVRLLPVGWQRQWGGALIFLFFFLVVYLGLHTLGKHIADGLHKTPLKWPDHILGFAGGIIKGALLIALLVAAVEWLDTAAPVKKFMWQSQLIRWGKQQAYGLLHWESHAAQKWV